MRKIINKGRESEFVEVVDDQVGSPTYARDLANSIIDIIVKSILNPQAYLPGIYHYANQGSCSWDEFTEEIFKLANINCKVVPVSTDKYPTKAKRPVYSVLDTAKVRSSFGIGIPNWRDSLKECISQLK
jgi:dTDP-4-dehydrorhamnose reductase